VGTLLEMVRDMATALALDGKRVKVCVQAAMGEGVFQVGVCERSA
jgi:adenylate kinase